MRNLSSRYIEGEIPTPGKIGPYRLFETIGQGSYSVVKRAQNVDTREVFACKIVPKQRLQHGELENKFQREVRILQQMAHPGIVKLVDILKDSLNYYIIFEYCQGGSLLDCILRQGSIPEEQAKIYFKQITDGLLYLHSKSIAHRDIKPENILIDSENHIRLIDFGFSAFTRDDSLLSTMCGTLTYQSPDSLSGKPYDGRRSDIWSLGVVLYAMLTGRTPWTSKDPVHIRKQIMRGEYVISCLPSEESRNLIRGMLSMEPESRLTIDKVCSHPWLEGVPNVLQIPKTLNSSVSAKKLDSFFELLPPLNELGGDWDTEIMESQKEVSHLMKITGKRAISQLKIPEIHLRRRLPLCLIKCN